MLPLDQVGFRVWDCGLATLEHLWELEKQTPGWAVGLRVLELVRVASHWCHTAVHLMTVFRVLPGLGHRAGRTGALDARC